jgi:flavin reductase (DIM6/NTAB) family NADH-FMN oxidoreductase RutF
MYYDSLSVHTGEGTPCLPWNPFKALVTPRPIGWISTLDGDGQTNLAPYSYFQAVSDRPEVVMFSTTAAMEVEDGNLHFSTGRRKHSQTNAERTGEFVCNLATWPLRAEMNATSAHFDADISEPDVVGIEMAPSTRVRPPRVAATPAALECVYLDTYVLPHRDGGHYQFQMVFGEVVGIYIDDSYVDDGRVDTAAMRPIARMGYDEYAVVESAFVMTRPDQDPILDRLLK